jgi:hypothetical protein
MSHYRVAPIKPYDPRPRTWAGRLRSLWRKALVWRGGTWKRRHVRVGRKVVRVDDWQRTRDRVCQAAAVQGIRITAEVGSRFWTSDGGPW